MRHLLFPCFASLLLSIFAYPSAHAQDLKEWFCTDYLPPSLNYTSLETYSIKARSNPPRKILTPGQTYEIRYELVTDCGNNCRNIQSHTLTHRAVLGPGRAALDSATNNIGSTVVGSFPCGDARVIFARFTVPSPSSLGATRENVSTVSMGICPPDYGFNCAGHTIRVYNSSSSGWKISGLTTNIRAIGSGSSRVPANQPFSLRAKITNLTGRLVWPASGGTAQLRQVHGYPSGTPQVINAQSLPNFGKGQQKTMTFPVQALVPGSYAFRACLDQLKDARGYPEPEICGPSTFISVGNAAAATWQVGGVQVSNAGELSSITPENRPFRLQVLIANKSRSANPSGGRHIIMLVRAAGRSGVPSRIFGTRGSVPAGQTIANFVQSRARAPGRYEFKACLGDSRLARVPDMICGPWSPIIVGTQRTRPTPQPGAPVANSCTGGRSPNTSGRCVCPSGTFWNPNPGFNRCYTCTGGRIWDRNGRRCVCTWGKSWSAKAGRCVKPARVQCPPTFVRHRIKNTCICPRGTFKIGNSCRRKPANSGTTIKRPDCRGGQTLNASGRCVNPARVTCRAPLVRNPVTNACICRRGYVKIGNSCRRKSTNSATPTKRPNCTGGRSLNATGRCVCRTGKRWSARVKRCVSVRVTCRSPFVRNPVTNSCICRRGYVKIGNSCRRKPKNSATQSSTRPSGKRKPAKTVNRKRCIGGKMKGSLCWCGIGKFPKRISKNVYRCR